MDNINQISVIRQWLSLLPINVLDRTLFDRYSKKLTVMKTIFIFVAAQLNRWSSYEHIETQIRAHSAWHEILDFTSISGSQLSRKLDQIPTELLEYLFLQGAASVQALSSAHGQHGISPAIGRLGIVDSSTFSLPLERCEWAKVSPKESGIKMHLRLIADSPDHVYPDAMVPTTVNVNDRDTTVDLITASDVTYVMDRGYEHFKKMDSWVQNKIRFVIRVRERTLTTVVEAYPVVEGSHILTDAKVRVGSKSSSMKHEIRLIEFLDEKGHKYKLFTTRWDLSAEEVARIYKARWLIELYFKWIKQHLHLVKVYSYKPQALWNQMFIGLIASLLIIRMKLKCETKKTPWQMLQILRTYMYLAWSDLLTELNREPTRKSRGRQQSEHPRPKRLRTTVGINRPKQPSKRKKKQ